MDVAYLYDGDGLRVQKTNNLTGVITNYLWDRNNLTGYPQVSEELQNGQVVRRFVYGPTGPLYQVQNTGVSWVTSYFGKDATGSVRFLMDGNGNITDSLDYDAFGNAINQTHTGTPTPNVYQFDGEYQDPHTGLIYLRARWMNPVIGRFMSMDTYEGDQTDPISLHKYQAFSNDPINKVDPSGYDDVFSISASENFNLWPTSLMGRTYGHTPSFQLEQFTKSWEGLTLFPYDKDGFQNSTIGWGHLMHPGPLSIWEKTEKLLHLNWINLQQAESFFQLDIAGAQIIVDNNIHVPLYQYEYDALVDLAFNLRPSSFEGSTVKAEVNLGNYSAAPYAFKILCGGYDQNGNFHVLDSLKKRRVAESQIFSSNIYNYSH